MVLTSEGTSEHQQTIAFVMDDVTATALRVGLMNLAKDVEIRKGGLTQAIKFCERHATAEVIIVDISEVEDAVLGLEDLARVCPPDVKVVVIGENTDITFYRMLKSDLGVAEYMHKPLTRDAVQRVLTPIISGMVMDQPGQRGGTVIVVCGARGGVGTTTIAVSLALELSTKTKSHVALLDLHLQNGTTAAMLSGQPGPGLRIALDEPERADALFLDRTSIEVAPRLRLVAADASLKDRTTGTAAGVSSVVNLLRQRCNFVVVDLPIPLTAAVQPVIDMARNVVTVMFPDVISLRDVKAIQQLVTDSTGLNRTITVLNRATMNGALQLPVISKGLGGAPDIVIPDLGKSMVEAANLGQPAIRRVPQLSQHLEPLLREIAGTPTVKTRSWFGKLINK